MTRYVIIGAGAVGATVAAQLHLAGRQVVLVARGAHLAALRADGLRYVRPDGEHRVELPVAAGADEVELAGADVLVLATKSQDTEQALREWAWQPVKLGDGTTGTAADRLPVLSLQNGLDNPRALLRRFATVIAATVYLPAAHLCPGVVVSPGAPAAGALLLGGYPHGAPEALAGIVADLRAAGLAARAEPEAISWQAGKLLANLANGLNALYPPSPLRTAALDALVSEGAAALRAAGVPFVPPGEFAADPDLSRVGIAPIDGYPRGGSSTWQSLARGASVETDFLNGEIVLLGRLHGVPVPRNAAIASRVQRAAREGTAAGGLDDADLAATLPGLRLPVLISPAELAGQLDDVALLDVRWALGDPHGHEQYRAGHLPGAVFVDLDRELAAPASPESGRHPLPALAELQASARRWGVHIGQRVVVYDNSGGLAAARAWWLLRWAGVADVRLLDGGLAGWTGSGRDLVTGEHTVAPGDVALTGGGLPVLTADEAAKLARTGVLLDARAGERYRGEAEPVDPRAGHIPGAVSAPTGENLTDQGAFRPAGELRARFAALGAEPTAAVGVYCGSGVTAAHQIAALAIAGIDAALYPGSWSQWSSDADRPVATGPNPN